MTRLKSSSDTSDAEEIHETQDTQAILDALKAELGVGVGGRFETNQLGSDGANDDAHTSAGRRVFPRSTLQAAGGSASAFRVSKKQYTSLNAGVKGLAKDIHLRRSSASQKKKTNDALVMQSSSIPAIDAATQQNGASQQRRMETSQQSPTQLNVDRDYGVYGNNVESSSPLCDTLIVGDEPEPLALMDDETGAVNFGDLSPGARQSSQISEDAGFENTRSEWPTSQHTSNNGCGPLEAQDLPPETPMISRNPFGARQDAAIPFAGSQLFKQTQLPTSAVKISPTSSRPSPNVPYESMLSHMMETSPLRNRANVSSPTVVPTSSPQPLHDLPPTSVTKQKSAPPLDETPRNSRPSRRDLAHSSPTVKLLRSSQTRHPLAHYEPMKRSQERKAADETLLINLTNDSDSDDDALLMLERRRRIGRKRAQATKEMGKVSVVRPAQRESEDPPGRKRRRINGGARARDIQQMDARDVEEAEQNNEIEEVPQGSRKAAASTAETVESTKATPGDHIEQTCSNDINNNSERLSKKTRTSKEMTDEEMIPATSPIRSLSAGVGRGARSASESELPPQFQEELDQSGDGETTVPPPASDTPFIRRRTRRSYGKQSRAQIPNLSSSVASDNESSRPKNTSSSPSSTPLAAVLNSGKTGQNNAKLSASPDVSTKSMHPTTTLIRQGDQTPATPIQSHAARPAVKSDSSQSSLTPVPSSGTTPETGLSPESDRHTSVSLPSSAAGRKGQRRMSRQLLKSGSPQLPRRAMRLGTRGFQSDIDLTDELQKSPSSSAPALSVTISKPGRTSKQLLGPSYLNRGRRIFENMAFAISMQSSQDRAQKRSALEQKITQAGGTILQDGFQGLFEASTVMSNGGRPTDIPGDAVKLLQSSLNCGFTALIADGHSRKVKYMQALALGLPCLAYQWITVCLNKGEIVGWEPYLLAAGSSAALGDAIRSRCLQPYPAVDAKLVEVIERRPRLLAGQSLLVVVDPKRARSETKKEYIFLAQALGPSVHRVSTAKEAHEALNTRRRANDPFDWIYIDEATSTIESVLLGGELPIARKRKRSSAMPIPHDIRVLKDELVIQSLISGRMIGEDEMNF